MNDYAEQHNKSAFFKKLFDHGDLTERQMLDALRLAPEDGAGEEHAKAAETYIARNAAPPDDRSWREPEARERAGHGGNAVRSGLAPCKAGRAIPSETARSSESRHLGAASG